MQNRARSTARHKSVQLHEVTEDYSGNAQPHHSHSHSRQLPAMCKANEAHLQISLLAIACSCLTLPAIACLLLPLHMLFVGQFFLALAIGRCKGSKCSLQEKLPPGLITFNSHQKHPSARPLQPSLNYFPVYLSLTVLYFMVYIKIPLLRMALRCS